MMRRWLPLGVCVLTLALGFVALAGDDKPPAADPKEVQKLIKDLSSNEFAVREAATKRLSELGEAVAADLEKALTAPDRETRRRADDILQEIRARRDEKELQKLLADLDKTPLDKLVTHIAKDPSKVTDAQWKALGKLIDVAVAQSNKVSGGNLKVPVDLAALKTETEPHRTGGGEMRFVTKGFGDSYTSFGRSAIICSGDTKWITSVSESLVIVNGDFEGATGVDNSIVICRGNFKRATSITNSLILCGGEFGGSTGLDNSVVQAAGIGRFTTTRNNVFINLPQVKATGSEGDRYVTAKADPLTLLRFTPKKEDKTPSPGEKKD